MLSQLEPDSGWGTWEGIAPENNSVDRVWPPSRGHGFAPSALSAAIQVAARSIRTGCSGAAKTLPVKACFPASGSVPASSSQASPMQTAEEHDAAEDPEPVATLTIAGCELVGWVGGKDRGVSGNPAPDRGLWT